MNTKKGHNETSTLKVGEIEFVIRYHGKDFKPDRKFKAKNIVYRRFRDPMNEAFIQDELLKGNEVRYGNKDGGIRFFPCLMRDYKTVNVTCQGYGWLCKLLKNIKWKFTSDMRFSIDECMKREDREKKLISSGIELMRNVSPDMTIKCWKCGAINRVGKKLV